MSARLDVKGTDIEATAVDDGICLRIFNDDERVVEINIACINRRGENGFDRIVALGDAIIAAIDNV